MPDWVQQILAKRMREQPRVPAGHTTGGQWTKGGPGSGNFGHAGRPGLVGGSLPGKTSGIPIAAQKGVVSGIREVMEVGAKNRLEAAIGLDLNGTKIGTTQIGTATSVKLHGILNAPIIIHNHPGTENAPPSDNDLWGLVGTPQEHNIIVTEGGIIYRLSKTEDTPRPDNGEYDDDSAYIKGGYLQKSGEALTKSMGNLTSYQWTEREVNKIRQEFKGTSFYTTDEVYHLAMHRLMKREAASVGVIYERIIPEGPLSYLRDYE